MGAELGADSVKAGRLFGRRRAWSLVALFMVLRYGLFGVFADIALTLNVVLLLAALTAVRRHPDAARHRRHRAHHGHGGGRQRADL